MKPATTDVPFIAVRKSGIVMRAGQFICRAASHTLAKRIARALNLHSPNDKGGLGK